jgi:hypothetical protein
MRQETMVRSRVVPWDDERFLHAYEGARRTALGEGLEVNGPKAARRVEDLLHAAGYPQASVECERTVEEAMRRIAIWTVRRDG